MKPSDSTQEPPREFAAMAGSALAQSWADAHDYLQSLCRKAGCSEFDVEGDSYGVPGIEQLAESLVERYEQKLRVLTDFINREMKMTAADPRVVALASALEMPNDGTQRQSPHNPRSQSEL